MLGDLRSPRAGRRTLAGASALALLLASTTAAPPAHAQEQSFREPFSAVMPNVCNGEIVTLSGYIHTSVQDVPDAGGGTHAVVQVNFQGVGGLGASGATYRLSGVTSHTNTNVTGGAIVASTEVSTHLIGQGTTPDQLLHLLVHTTINANGEMTSEITDVRSECQ